MEKVKTKLKIISEWHVNGLLIYIILGIALIFSILLFDPKLSTGGDNAVYISLARSILSGKGYTSIYLPDEPPQIKYPPGYPLLLAGFLSIFKNSYIPLKILSIIFFLGSIYFFHQFLKMRNSSIFIYFPLFLISVSPLMLKYSHLILSEMTFIFFVLLTIYLFELWESKRNYLLFISASISGIICYLIRSIGITLIIGILIYLFFKRFFKKAIIFLFITVVFVLPWNLRNINVQKKVTEKTYIEQILSKEQYFEDSPLISFGDFIERVWKNINTYGNSIIPNFIFPFFYRLIKFNNHNPLNYIIVLLPIPILGLVLFGFLKDMKNGKSFYHLFLIFYIIIVLAWPHLWSSPRFLLPILPFILLYFFIGINFKSKKSSLLIIIFGFIAVIGGFSEVFHQIPRSLKEMHYYVKGFKMEGYSSDWIRFFEASDWIKENTSPNSIITCRKPALFYIRANRKAFTYPISHEHEKILDGLKKADFILLDNFKWTETTQKLIVPAMKKNMKCFKQIYMTKEPYTFVVKVEEECKK